MEIRYGNNYIAKGCNDALGRIKRKKESKRFLKGMKIDLRQKVKDKNNSCCYNGIQAPLVFMLLVISYNQNSFDHKSHKHQQYNIILCNLKDYLPSLLLYLSSKGEVFIFHGQAHKSIGNLWKKLLYSNNAINLELYDRCFALASK